MKKLALALVTLAFSSLSLAGSSIEVLGAEETRRLNLPFSEAVAIGDLLFLSGQIGNRPGEFKLVDGGIQAQTRQTMKNVIAILNKHGSRVDQLIKCTIFLANMDDWGEMNIAYIEALGDHRPARSALGVSGIALGGSVEIECIAAR